ncbi:hypothetical protein MASR2M8_22350 [Opitutaceae bacterium]
MNMKPPAWILPLVLAAALHAAAPAPLPADTRLLKGTLENTTHAVSAPARFELTFEGEAVRGFLTVEAPLKAGRFPVEGTKRGAWCEVICRYEDGTRTVFRGVIDDTGYRGTYVFGGGGQLVQYGRFETAR